jgi:hypothetical protein
MIVNAFVMSQRFCLQVANGECEKGLPPLSQASDDCLIWEETPSFLAIEIWGVTLNSLVLSFSGYVVLK